MVFVVNGMRISAAGPLLFAPLALWPSAQGTSRPLGVAGAVGPKVCVKGLSYGPVLRALIWTLNTYQSHTV